jgi:hypothetical protein
MAVPAVNIVIEKGADYFATFTITKPDGTAYDLSDSSALSTLRKYPESDTISATFSSTITVATGKVTVSLGNTITSDLDMGRYYYNIVVTNNNSLKKTRVIEGMAIVS